MSPPARALINTSACIDTPVAAEPGGLEFDRPTG